ncbi:MAG: transketolase [Chitinivibrionales bacterium]|nr:transketolase [Chitinivibrionales bacterium]
MRRSDILFSSIDIQKLIHDIKPFPHRMSIDTLYPCAYYYMYLSRRLEEKTTDLFRSGKVKGTVTISIGNEATAVGMALPFRHGTDVFSLLQRDFGAHLVAGQTPFNLMCQYMANAKSPTHGREGNVHHGDAKSRRFPMISHLGNMLGTIVGGVYAARLKGENAFGLTVSGDGGTSTGDFHESINLASVRKCPVLFLIENNQYAFSTPVSLQYNCEKLSVRAASYGIKGKTIDGTSIEEVYTAVCDALDYMNETSLPYLLECDTLRMKGHAVYDNAEYISPEQQAAINARDPLPKTRAALLEKCSISEEALVQLEQTIDTEIERVIAQALQVERPTPKPAWDIYAPPNVLSTKPFSASGIKHLTGAINLALDHILENNPEAFCIGQDIGPYGSAFKTCKGLHKKYGNDRIMDMPICESASTGFALGASQTGGRPIFEFQFADFSTEAVTQLGLNSGTWYFRTGTPAPLLFRLPCGGGITLGAFHSGEFEGLWSRFPGLKLLYPFTPQETFEAIVAGYYDLNPCIVFEHKLLYGAQKGDIEFDGNLENVWRPRHYHEGNDLTVITWGAIARHALRLAEQENYSLDIWNPFVFSPIHWKSLADSVHKTGRLLVVQESGVTAGLGNHIISTLTRECFSDLKTAPMLIAAPDSPVPFAQELESQYLPSLDHIRSAVKNMIGATQ